MTFLMGLINALGADSSTISGAADTLKDVINNLLAPALILVASAGAFYSIWLGIKLAKAEDEEKQKAAKKHLIGVITAVIVVVALIFLFYFVADNIEGWIGEANPSGILNRIIG